MSDVSCSFLYNLYTLPLCLFYIIFPISAIIKIEMITGKGGVGKDGEDHGDPEIRNWVNIMLEK